MGEEEVAKAIKERGKMNKFKKVLMFLTFPIWIMPLFACKLIGYIWEEISEYIDEAY